MKELSDRKFIELLRMMAGQNEGGFGEVFREAARRLDAGMPIVLTCDGCVNQKDFPSHETCHGCARVYSDNYRSNQKEG